MAQSIIYKWLILCVAQNSASFDKFMIMALKRDHGGKPKITAEKSTCKCVVYFERFRDQTVCLSVTIFEKKNSVEKFMVIH